MKAVIAILLALAATSALAKRPHIVPCDTYATIAQEAAASRDTGKTLQDAQDRLADGHRWDTYYRSYQSLVGQVFESQALRAASPDDVYLAARKACLAFNDEERRTMRLD
jgi:hypothetical protein